jgi:pimeloyl-ACP methyl ester carboxylesterase
MVASVLGQFATVDDRLELLAAHTTPTLVIVGEQDKPFIGPSERMADVMPGASLAVIPDGGHSPQFESPDEWWRALSGFLDRVQEGAAA